MEKVVQVAGCWFTYPWLGGLVPQPTTLLWSVVDVTKPSQETGLLTLI